MDTHNDSVFHFVQPIHVHDGHDGVDVCDALGQPRSTLRAREDVPVARVTSEDGEKAGEMKGERKFKDLLMIVGLLSVVGIVTVLLMVFEGQVDAALKSKIPVPGKP